MWVTRFDSFPYPLNSNGVPFVYSLYLIGFVGKKTQIYNYAVFIVTESCPVTAAPDTCYHHGPRGQTDTSTQTNLLYT